MRVIRLFKKLSSALIVSLLLLPTLTLAKDIPLYDTPAANAKVVGKVDLAKGIVPIFTSKDGKWMKVGNPNDGSVGWMKSDAINNSGMSFTFSQQMIDNGKSGGSHTFQIMQFGNDKNNDVKTQEMLKKMQLQQQNLQRSIDASVVNMLNEINSLNSVRWNATTVMPPMIVPVVLMPTK